MKNITNMINKEVALVFGGIGAPSIRLFSKEGTFMDVICPTKEEYGNLDLIKDRALQLQNQDRVIEWLTKCTILELSQVKKQTHRCHCTCEC
jgi:hypothetical protein